MQAQRQAHLFIRPLQKMLFKPILLRIEKEKGITGDQSEKQKWNSLR